MWRAGDKWPACYPAVPSAVWVLGAIGPTGGWWLCHVDLSAFSHDGARCLATVVLGKLCLHLDCDCVSTALSIVPSLRPGMPVVSSDVP